MIEKVLSLAESLKSCFSDVVLSDDVALQKTNVAVLFIEKISTEYMTLQRKRKTCNTAMIFSVEGQPQACYQEVDAKLKDIESILESSFNHYEIGEVEFSYVKNVKKLFVFIRFSFSWEL